MRDGIPDNYDLFEAHEAKMYAEARRRPKCSICEEPIWDDYAYRIDGKLICPDCLDNNFREHITEDEW